MTDEPTKNPFKLVEITPRIEANRDLTPNEKVIRVLEWCMEKAKKGELHAVAVAAVDHDNGIVTSWIDQAHKDANVHILAAAIAHLSFRYQNEVYQQTKAERDDIY